MSRFESSRTFASARDRASPRRLRFVISAAFACSTLLAAAADADYRVFVTNELSGDLSVIAGEPPALEATVPLGKRPRGLAAGKDGHHLYVALSGSPIAPPGVDESSLPPPDKAADGIGVYSIADGRLETIIRGVDNPEQLGVGPDGELFVPTEDTGAVVIAEGGTGRILGSVPIGSEPEGIAVSPDRRVVYVTAEGDNRVAVVDAASRKKTAELDVGQRPRGVAFSPDGKRAYVTGELDASLTIIDTAAVQVLRRVTVPGEGARPMGVVASPNGATIYVTTGRGGTLVALDAESGAPKGSVRVGERPWGVALSPDGRYAFTANGPSNDVSIVDTEAMRVVGTLKVGTRPWGVAVVNDLVAEAPGAQRTRAVGGGDAETSASGEGDGAGAGDAETSVGGQGEGDGGTDARSSAPESRPALAATKPRTVRGIVTANDEP
jgi:YVTN family beta-propeller protein